MADDKTIVSAAGAGSETLKATEEALTDYHTTNLKRRMRCVTFFVLMAIAFVIITIVNINSGNVHIGVGEIARAIFLHEGTEKTMDIIWTIRLPRIITSAVLGISSGAKMVVAVVLILFMQSMKYVSSFTLIAAAFAGSMIATLFILAVSKRVHNMASLLVAGIMVGNICTALTEFVITFAEDSDIANLHSWQQGSFSGMTWANVWICIGLVGVCFIITLAESKPISAFQLGESYAQSIGVNIKFFRVLLISLSSLFSACVTAFAGPISFVGIAVPFLVKGAMGTSKPLVIIPGCMMGGAVFCMFSDLIARLAFAPVELNISTVTAIFGAPVVIYMMIAKRRLANA